MTLSELKVAFPTMSPQEILTRWYTQNPNERLQQSPALPNSGYSNQPSLLSRIRGLAQDAGTMSRGTGG